MNDKTWTKQEVLDLLKKQESDIPREIEIDDGNELVWFHLRLPFTIHFNKGHWKLFFKTEKDVWGKLKNNESIFGALGVFEKEFNTFFEYLCLQAGLTKDAIYLEKEERMSEYDKERHCQIMQDGMQINIGIRCKTAQTATNISCNLITL